MPYKEKEIEKLYYSIGEVSEMLGVNASLIRFWEKQFGNIKPHKNKKGDRLFTIKEIEKLKEIHHLVKDQGYKLEGAKKQLKSKSVQSSSEANIHSHASKTELLNLLLNAKEKLIRLKSDIKL